MKARVTCFAAKDWGYSGGTAANSTLPIDHGLFVKLIRGDNRSIRWFRTVCAKNNPTCMCGARLNYSTPTKFPCVAFGVEWDEFGEHVFGQHSNADWHKMNEKATKMVEEFDRTRDLYVVVSPCDTFYDKGMALSRCNTTGEGSRVECIPAQKDFVSRWDANAKRAPADAKRPPVWTAEGQIYGMKKLFKIVQASVIQKRKGYIGMEHSLLKRAKEAIEFVRSNRLEVRFKNDLVNPLAGKGEDGLWQAIGDALR